MDWEILRAVRVRKRKPVKQYYTQNTHFFGNTSPEALLRDYGSPLYVYNEAILRQRCLNDGLGDDPGTLTRQFRLHLCRGINHYSSRDVLKNCADLLNSARSKERA